MRRKLRNQQIKDQELAADLAAKFPNRTPIRFSARGFAAHDQGVVFLWDLTGIFDEEPSDEMHRSVFVACRFMSQNSPEWMDQMLGFMPPEAWREYWKAKAQVETMRLDRITHEEQLRLLEIIDLDLQRLVGVTLDDVLKGEMDA